MSRMVQVSDLDPSVLRDIVSLALLGGFIRVLRSNGVDVVLCLEIEFAMEMSKLMARSRVLHCCPRHNFISMLIDDKGFSAINALNLILSLFSSYNKDLVLSLNGRKV